MSEFLDSKVSLSTLQKPRYHTPSAETKDRYRRVLKSSTPAQRGRHRVRRAISSAQPTILNDSGSTESRQSAFRSRDDRDESGLAEIEAATREETPDITTLPFVKEGPSAEAQFPIDQRLVQYPLEETMGPCTIPAKIAKRGIAKKAEGIAEEKAFLNLQGTKSFQTNCCATAGRDATPISPYQAISFQKESIVTGTKPKERFSNAPMVEQSGVKHAVINKIATPIKKSHPQHQYIEKDCSTPKVKKTAAFPPHLTISPIARKKAQGLEEEKAASTPKGKSSVPTTKRAFTINRVSPMKNSPSPIPKTRSILSPSPFVREESGGKPKVCQLVKDYSAPKMKKTAAFPPHLTTSPIARKKAQGLEEEKAASTPKGKSSVPTTKRAFTINRLSPMKNSPSPIPKTRSILSPSPFVREESGGKPKVCQLVKDYSAPKMKKTAAFPPHLTTSPIARKKAQGLEEEKAASTPKGKSSVPTTKRAFTINRVSPMKNSPSPIPKTRSILSPSPFVREESGGKPKVCQLVNYWEEVKSPT